MVQEPVNQPPYVVHQTDEGVTWFAIRDYGFRIEGLREGTGCFYSFQSTNKDGKWGDWVLLNGGLIDRTPGNEQGDLDLIVTVDGKPNGVAVVGNMTTFGGPDAGLVPIQTNRLDLGNLWQRFRTLFVQKLNIETVGKQICINGVWQWRDCVLVETQQGQRWMPVFPDFTQGDSK